MLLAPLIALTMGAAPPRETRLVATLPASLSQHVEGRLLVFAERVTAANADPDRVDTDVDNEDVAVAARDVSEPAASGGIVIDLEELSFPKDFAITASGKYRVQVVLDRDGNYAYAGRGPGDIVSKVFTLSFPLASVPEVALDRTLPPESDQFDTTGFPQAAVDQIAASRPHMHDERIASRALKAFRGTPQSVSAWVLTPPGYDQRSARTYPTVYTANGFGTNHKSDGQQLSRIWHLMETGAIPPMIWVSLDYATRTGTTEFADSLNNGPWGQALVTDVIPALERRYRMDARPSGRFLTGHSSGGWFALWTMVTHPKMFGGAWASAPDPVDFRDFLGVDLYAPGANLYRDAQTASRPMERAGGEVLTTIERSARLETVLGRSGGQLRSFEWVFSPHGADGAPVPLFDRATGDVDPTVASYWRDHYDIGHRIERDWPRLKRDLYGKIHVAVGTLDSFYLDGAVHRLQAAFRQVGGHAEFTFVPGASHSLNEVYTRNGDRTALWKEMTRAMYRIARR